MTSMTVGQSINFSKNYQVRKKVNITFPVYIDRA